MKCQNKAFSVSLFARIVHLKIDFFLNACKLINISPYKMSVKLIKNITELGWHEYVALNRNVLKSRVFKNVRILC